VQTRKAFLENWKDNFAKPFDVICHWSFKNKSKLYGSIQFESLVKADKNKENEFEDTKLDYFNEVVGELLEYSHE